MISGFLTSLSIPRPRQHIEERLTLIIDFYHLLLRLLAAKRFDKRTNRVSTDVADKHAARYMHEIAASPAKSRRSRMNFRR